MKPHEERVIVERDELYEKFNKLESFIATEFFNSLPENGRELLKEQQGYMSAYLSVLNRRIDLF